MHSHRQFRKSLTGLLATGMPIAVVYRYGGKLYVVPPDDAILGVSAGRYPDTPANQRRLDDWFRRNPTTLLAYCNFHPGK